MPNDTSVSTGPPPSWLDTPATGAPRPPTRTQLQELPFKELGWENFERLCLRLVREEAEVEYCRQYGTAGQDQQGIDLYARKGRGSKYLVYQCKNVQRFGPADIKQAVTDFLEGGWASKTGTFTICTRESLRETNRSDELERQRKRLEPAGVSLASWDADELVLLLKQKPRLVDEFFGRSWVEPFCGADHSKTLENLLDNARIIELRKRLLGLYRNLFAIHDPGFPPVPGIALPFEQRYVVHDVYEQRSIASPAIEAPSPPSGKENEWKDQSGAENRSPSVTTAYSQRRRLPDSLAEGPRHVLVGGPGTGKSSILRFLCIDLLTPNPRLTAVARTWGSHLPIWISFPYWTRLLAERQASLEEAVHAWLLEVNEEQLWPLFRDALRDDRLLLVVDGLDEYTSESSGRSAKSLLELFVAQRNCPIVATSRPAGLDRLGAVPADWRTTPLAEFSVEQQSALARIWFFQQIRVLEPASNDDAAIASKCDRSTIAFVDELQRSSDLRDLAETPLLLCLLLYLKSSNVPLPPNRFLALRQLVDHLLSTHPRQRRTAALFTSEPQWSDEDARKVFSALAFEIQRAHPQGSIPTEDARSATEEFLKDPERGFGLAKADAYKQSREFLDLGESSLGLLVKRTPREFAFLHRSFQDYLSAFHLSRLPFADQLDIAEAHCADPQWREILLGLLHLTQRPDEVSGLLLRVRGKAVARAERYAVGSLLTEASVGNFNCPSQLAKELCQLAIDEIETGTWLPHREHLLRTVLGGLTSISVRDLLVRSIPTWFPDRGYSVSSVLKAMGTWPRTPEVISCLFRALHNEYQYHAGAIQALSTIAADDASVAGQLLSLASGSASVSTRYAAMEALLNGNPDHPGWPKLASEMNGSRSSEFRTLCIRWKIHAGLQTQEDLHFLLTLAGDPLSHNSSSVSASTLLRGWPQSQAIRELAIRSVADAPRGYLNRDLSILLLIEGFPNDDEVRRILADLIRQDKSGTFGFQDWEIWKSLSANYKGDTEIVSALDDWLSTADRSWEPTAAFAALVGRTPLGKRKLLEYLSSSSVPHWATDALLEGWGMDEPQVGSALRFTADSQRAVRIAGLLPRIIDDREECYQRLIALLREPSCERPDFVMSGLVELGTDRQNDVIKASLPFVDNRMFGANVAAILMEHFARDARIRELALKQLKDRDGNIGAVARAFGHDTDIRQTLIALAVPLPPSLRTVIIDFLGQNAKQNTFCLNLLRLYDYERDPSLKVRAAIKYYATVAGGGSLGVSLEELSATLICSGPDFQERQQAAFVGLDILGRLDLMLAAASKYGDNRVAINLGRSLSTNAPLVRHILSRWDLIKRALGNRFPSILSRFDDPWRHILAFADEYDAVREEAIEHCLAPPVGRLPALRCSTLWAEFSRRANCYWIAVSLASVNEPSGGILSTRRSNCLAATSLATRMPLRHF